ncbi:MAG TPA: O-antigen ligase family protein, partial [Chloroflexia bacterium]|nr:O-antigen ligase family protein [Chloroflexia bacterium]
YTAVSAPPRAADDDAGPPPVLLAVLPMIQISVLLVGIFLVGALRVPDFSLWIVYPGAIFVVYALTYLYTMARRPSAESNLLQLIGLPILLVMQIVVIFLTQSRGPLLGLLLGLGVFAFALLLRRRLYRPLAALVVVTLLFGGLLVVWNLPASPLASWRSLPYIGRLGLLSQLEEGTGKVRTLIWGGAYNLITSDPVRMLIGWGPESMYVAYNKFYPPELGHWELRNATPDRSHDVFFDQAVTMGLLGLVAYLFLIAAFLWYSVRALRKAPRLHEQLILIGFMSMVIAHIGELIAGIQIVATYTYFYMGIAAMVVVGYVLNDYLRPAVVPEPATAEEAAGDGVVADAPAHDGTNGHDEQLVAAPARRGVPVAAGKSNGRGTSVPVAARPGPTTATAPPRRPPAGAPGSKLPPAGRATAASRPNYKAMGAPGSYAARQPGLLALYGGLVLLGLFLIIGLNVNLVKADMFYKQGLAYDGQQGWPGSVGPYEKAISISPNEDFYYLFLGRAYMEWAKHLQSFQGSPPAAQLLSSAERALLTAQSLNPLNTDHYANLGRLYVYWADGMADPQTTGIQGTPQDQGQRYDQGLAQYEKAHALSPGNASIWNELALAYAKAGRYDDAITAIRGSQQMDDRYDQTHFIAGEIERSRAEGLAAEAANAAPGVITSTLVLSATREAEAAAADYAKAVKLTPNQLQQDSSFDARIAFLGRYNALPILAAGYQSVISDALAARAKDPTRPPEPVQARAALGYLQWKSGHTLEAVTEFERAIALQCNDFYNLQNLAMLYRDSGKDEQALNMFQAALAVADCDPQAAYNAQCATLQNSTSKGTCTPLANDPNLAATINGLRSEVQQLKQKLGRP